MIASMAGALAVAAGALGYAYYVGVFAPPFLKPGEEIGDGHYLYPASEDGKWGYIDASGQVVLPFRPKNPYESDNPHDEGPPPVTEPPYRVIADGSIRWLNRAGKDVFKRSTLQAIGKFREGLAPAIPASASWPNLKWGFVDVHGKFVIEPRFERASEFSEGLAAVSIDGQRWGYIDRTGNLVITPRFDRARSFKEGVAEVREGDGHRLIDRLGNAVGTIRSDQSRLEERGLESYEATSEGMWPVYVDGAWGFADTQGNLVIKPQFESVGLFRDGLAPAGIDKQAATDRARAGAVQKSWENGKAAAERRLQELKDQNAPIAEIRAAEKALAEYPPPSAPAATRPTRIRVGFIDKSGKWVIPPRFDEAGEFRRGLARVVVGVYEGRPRMGFIDKTGRFVIQPVYDEANPFWGEITRVVRGGKMLYIDTSGRVVWSAGTSTARAPSASAVGAADDSMIDRLVSIFSSKLNERKVMDVIAELDAATTKRDVDAISARIARDARITITVQAFGQTQTQSFGRDEYIAYTKASLQEIQAYEFANKVTRVQVSPDGQTAVATGKQQETVTAAGKTTRAASSWEASFGSENGKIVITSMRVQTKIN